MIGRVGPAEGAHFPDRNNRGGTEGRNAPFVPFKKKDEQPKRPRSKPGSGLGENLDIVI